jgi:dCMP deaminase
MTDNRPTWKQTFVDVAKVISKRSKDPRTKVGAVLVKNNCIIGTGYNGDPRNFNYNFNWNNEEKYDYVIHAEMNCIANAVYNGAGNSIKDSEIYLTLSPCSKCILLLIQFGVKKVYFLEKYKDFELTEKIAKHADIELIKI